MDNIKEINGINIENIGKINAVTKGYFKNKNGVSYERYPYDANHIAVYRMMEASGTTVKNYVGSSNGTADSGLAIATGYGINKKCRSWATTGYKIDSSLNLKLNPITIRFKIKRTGTNTENATLIDTCYLSPMGARGYVVNFGTDNKCYMAITFLNANFAQLNGNKVLDLNVWYDIQFTWDGLTTTNGVKQYVRALTGTDAGKWYDTSNVAQTSIVVNSQATAPFPGSNISSTYNLRIGLSQSAIEGLKNYDVQDLQFSDIVRTDMKDYI